MCGFVGFVSPGEFAGLKADLRAAVSSLWHRGPDDDGLFCDESQGVGLAHRRLSILDLSTAGRQPLHNDDQSLQVVYNGEIYNFGEIRKNLEGLGHRFRSATDTEVVVKAYQQWGHRCLERFIGMFALGIWDRKAQTLFLARDRLGIKPLYYHFHHGIFLFASELKAFMAFNSFQRVIDPDVLPLFLHYQYIPAPHTIFQQTWKLPPGHFAVFDGKRVEIQEFWQCPRMENDWRCEKNITEPEAVERLDSLISRAVSDRLISDVPLGALLSGGIDSSLVVAHMQKICEQPVKTFSIGFQEQGFDEAPWASRIAEHLGTDHTELYVGPEEALATIPKLPHIYDEPFADSSAIPTYLVSKLTRNHVTVALSGDGGDELFAGYVRYWMTRSMASWSSFLPASIKPNVSRFLKSLPVDLMEKCYLPLRDRLPQRFRVANFKDKWQKLIMSFDQSLLSEIYRTTVCLWPEHDIRELTGRDLQRCRFEALFDGAGQWPTISQLMYVDLHTYLPDCMLTKVDRASMANGLEVRVPLLDHRVVEYAANLSEALKYRDGSGKYLLKKLLTRYVPEKMFNRPKMGFGVPLESWLRNELREMMVDYLSPARLERGGHFNSKAVEKAIKEHLEGTCNHHHRLWALLMWEMWWETWSGQNRTV